MRLDLPPWVEIVWWIGMWIASFCIWVHGLCRLDWSEVGIGLCMGIGLQVYAKLAKGG